MLTGILPVPGAAVDAPPFARASPTVREVRTVDAKDIGALRPTGIAYDRTRAEFLVAEDGADGAVVRLLDRRWELLAVTTIPGVSDASSLDFDRDFVTWTVDGGVLGVPGEALRSRRPILPGEIVSMAEVGATDLAEADSGRLVAANDEDGLLYVLDRDAGRLDAFDVGGDLVETYDATTLDLRSPEAMAFAPSTDNTDDADNLNLFVVDSGDETWDGGVTELTLEQSMLVTAETVSASLVQVIDTSAWNPPSTDPSGIVWNPSVDRLIVVDSEVEETRFFQGVNMWHISRGGSVLSTGATWGPQSAGSYSDEPTGLGYDNVSDTLFVSDDTGTRSVFVVKSGPDGLFGTTDDVVSTINMGSFGATDTEDPEYDPVSGHLFVLSGTDREIYRIDPVDGVFANGNDIVTSFDISHLGPTDFEGLTSSVARGSLFVGSRNTDQIFEITHDGQLVRTIDVSSIGGLGFVSGLAMAPSSTDPSVMSLWIVDRGVDEVNDGELFEISVPDLSDPVGNLAPVVDAGPDQSVPFPDPALLSGEVNDDGLPEGGVLTTTWSKASGPGDVTFADATALSTAATFSEVGVYVLELTASDGELTSSDSLVINVTSPPNSAPTIEPIADVFVGEGETVVVPVSVSDPDGDELSIVAEGLPSFASFDEVAREITIAPGAGDAGQYGPVTVTVSDGDPGGGQAPQFRSSASATITGASGSVLTIARPAGVQAGDVLVAQIRYRTTSSGSPNLTAPPGWIVVGTIVESHANHTVLYRIAGDSEPAGYAFDQNTNAGRMSGGIGAYVGADPANPIHAWAASAPDTSTLVAPDVASTIDGTTVIRLWGWRGSSASDPGVGFNAPPSGVTQRWSEQVGHSNSDRNRVLAGDEIRDVAGAVGSSTASGSASTAENRRSGFTLVLAPAFSGLSDSTSFDITVTEGEPGNAAPVAADDSVSTAAGVAVVVDVLANDSDGDGDPLSVVDVSDPAGGSVVVNADETVTYTPDAGFSGSDSFTYRASDGVDVSNVATVTVDVASDGVVFQYAAAQNTTYGSVSGGLETLLASDDTSQQLTEVHTGGPPPTRISRLDHSWTFDVSRGEIMTFHLEARRTDNSEGDDFAFSYSTDGGTTFHPLVVVASTTDTNHEVELPNTISGTVIVRVVDTDRSTGNGSTESLFVDRMFIRSESLLAPLPTVTVTATAPQANEDGTEGGFTITRTGSTGSLTVYYIVSGTAEPGVDYEPLLGMVFFTDGQASATVQVVPIDDDLAEGNESVVLSLVADSTYQVGSPSEASVVVVDDDLASTDVDASSQSTVMGTVVAGDLASTFADDDLYLQIREESWAGGKRSRLEHRWTFDVTPASAVTFFVQAHHTGDEDFLFAYSLDGSNWAHMLTVVAESDTGTYQTYSLPSNVNGVVHVRVVDADRSNFEPALDSIHVDDMFVRLEP
jgi:hypothetical protein